MCVGKESKPPARINPSKAFLFAALKSTRLVTSKIDLNDPFSFRSLIIAFTAEPPTPLIAPIPKRTAPSLFTENFKYDSLISGPRTSNPIRLHSSIKKDTDLISLILLERTEAMYSAG